MLRLVSFVSLFCGVASAPLTLEEHREAVLSTWRKIGTVRAPKNLMSYIDAWRGAGSDVETYLRGSDNEFNGLSAGSVKYGALLWTRPEEGASALVETAAYQQKYEQVFRLSATASNSAGLCESFSRANSLGMKYVVLLDDLDAVQSSVAGVVSWLRCAARVVAVVQSVPDDAAARLYFRDVIKLPATRAADITAYITAYMQKMLDFGPLAVEGKIKKALTEIEDSCGKDKCTVGEVDVLLSNVYYHINTSDEVTKDNRTKIFAERLKVGVAEQAARLKAWQKASRRRKQDGSPAYNSSSEGGGVMDFFSSMPVIVWAVLFFAAFTYLSIGWSRDSIMGPRRPLASSKPSHIGAHGIPGMNNMPLGGSGGEFHNMKDMLAKKQQQAQAVMGSSLGGGDFKQRAGAAIARAAAAGKAGAKGSGSGKTRSHSAEEPSSGA